MDEPNLVSKWCSVMQMKYREKWKAYDIWVIENPESVARVEGGFRTIAYASYMFTGSEVTEQVLPEFAYALSNLFVFFNDNILRKAFNICRQTTLTEAKLTQWLTIIEHIEVFVELAAMRLAGPTGRWIIIAAVHILRAIFRLILLFKHGSGIQPVPPLSTLKRDPKLLKESHPPVQSESDYHEDTSSSQNTTYRGQRSGRVIRTLDAAPDINRRSWKLPDGEEQRTPRSPEQLVRTELEGLPLVGELLHISRPVVHLACLFRWGQGSWKPWITALVVDIANLFFLSKLKRLNIKESVEINRRITILLLYLLRSPCFDNYSKAKLLGFFGTTGKIWGLQTISKSIVDYLPRWQQIYFYNWMQ